LGGVQVQAEMRMHDLSDGFLIPGPKSQPKVISGISSTNLQIRTNVGANYIELTPTGQVNIVGNLHVQGTIIASGEITGGATAIPLSTHHHTGVTPGGGTSGPPTP
jgi:phage baseplate assembly protein gpV